MRDSRLTRKIKTANADGRKAIIPYLPAGYPTRDRFWEEIRTLDDCGADIIEIGIPFSDPVADGPVIEAAALKCLEQGINMEWVLSSLKKERPGLKAEIVLMGYYNPFLQYGLEKMAHDAADAGVAGIICPDLPLEESDEFVTRLEKNDIDLVSLVGLNTDEKRLKMYEKKATGFIYFVSVMGITGGKTALPEALKQGLEKARSIFSLPIALGFGLKSMDQLAEVEPFVDAVVFGSSLIRHIDANKPTADFMAGWR